MLRKELLRQKRRMGIRKRIVGTADRPRVAIFRSNNHMYAQVIDDSSGFTIASGSDLKITKGTKIERSKEFGVKLAESMESKGIEEVVFDRGGYKYHGCVKMVADALREGGIKL